MYRGILLAVTLMVTACGGDQNTKEAVAVEKKPVSESEALGGEALAKKYIIVDTHIDVPWRLKKNMEDVGFATEKGQFDYPRAQEGGLNVPFMSIYIPASVDEEGGATALADDLIDLVENIVTDHPEKFALAVSTASVEKNFKDGKISLALGMENGGPIAGDFKNLKHFYDRGIRYITLTHSKSNHISDSSYDDNKRWDGLSEFGEQLIPEMNRLGVMVDISHVSDAAFYDVLSISKVPVIASHSSARHFVPGFERNMDDEMLKALANNGGVMQLNIGSTFISNKSRESSNLTREMGKKYLEENKLDPDSETGKAALEKIKLQYPFSYANMDDVLDHVDHVVKVTGIDHIGIGSDFDGVGDSLPVGFKDVSDYPAFIDGLLSRGYTEAQIEKILSGNLMRVWQEVEQFALNSK
ncbi:MAG: membrane dipeptidase [Candidatus Azotimanducaceae bacterium]|jgi:membrane dipeptidase